MLKEYDVQQDVMTHIMSAISISKNHVPHSKTKHIDIHPQFIKDLVKYKVISLEHVNIENKLVDILTKALDTAQFEKLRATLGVCLSDL